MAEKIIEFVAEKIMDLSTLRHSCSHILAQAVKEIWPETKLGIGPSIEEGFYYDFDRPEPFTDQDLVRIEERMQQIIDQNEPFIREEFTKEEAMKLFKRLKEGYKLELIDEIEDERITVYKTGENFIDLCKGPHVESTGKIKAFKLLTVAGAYWHGIETNPMLQRIYGTCFEAKRELDDYLKNLEEAKKRDHRKLGLSLDLFNFYYGEAGTGLVFYHPKGAILRTIIEDYLKREHLRRGYQLVITPHIMQASLWKTSGHYDYYRENMYTLKIEAQEFVLKPMNCPGHILIYKSKIRSWKSLPLRYFELGTVYRYEKSGVLHGLLRLRGFTQDDSHIFCLEEQLKDEIKGILDFVLEVMSDFGFGELVFELSTRPKKFLGSLEIWERAEDILTESLKEKEFSFKINPGEGAFYGPKIDIKLKDALKRLWQCATIQCDFALPEKFDLGFIDSKGERKRPVMLHRVILGSLERFIGCLIEHYGGNLPLWLAPLQIVIIPIKTEHARYASEIKERFTAEGLRVDLDCRNETLEKRIRDSELEKIPYLLVIGEKEMGEKKISVRKRKEGNLGSMDIEEFIKRLTKI